MKILRFIYDWPPPWSGLAPGPHALTKAQAEAGNELVVICGGGSLLFKSREVAKIKNTKIIRLPRTLPGVGPFFTTAPLALLAYFYYKVKFKPDVVHGHGHITLFFNIYRYFVGWLDKTPYVLHFHNTAAGREKMARTQSGKIPLLTTFVEWPLHKLSDYLGCLVADKLLFVSEDTADEAKEFYLVGDKSIVLENGVDCETFTPKGEVAQVFGHNPVLLWQGALSKRKRVDLLIRAVSFLKSGVCLLLIGSGSEKDNLERLVNSLNLEDRVKFVGYLANDKTPPYFRRANLAVFPSSYEGFPKVALEALACGIPTLASGFRVDPPVSGLAIASFERPEELSETIQKLMDSPMTVDVDKIVNRFSWETIAGKLQKIYVEIKLRN